MATQNVEIGGDLRWFGVIQIRSNVHYDTKTEICQLIWARSLSSWSSCREFSAKVPVSVSRPEPKGLDLGLDISNSSWQQHWWTPEADELSQSIKLTYNTSTLST